jgi:hypothetical protein
MMSSWWTAAWMVWGMKGAVPAESKNKKASSKAG